jgi:hypothetical protein
LDQQVGHGSFVYNIAIFVYFQLLSQLIIGAKISRQALSLIYFMDAKLVKHIAILRELGEVIVVQGEVSVPRVMGREERKPGFDCCAADAKALAELPVHLGHMLRTTRPEDNNIQVFGEQRQLAIYLANITKEVYNMPAVLILLTPNLYLVSYSPPQSSSSHTVNTLTLTCTLAMNISSSGSSRGR